MISKAKFWTATGARRACRTYMGNSFSLHTVTAWTLQARTVKWKTTTKCWRRIA